MKYLLTIYGDESGWNDVTPEQSGEIMAAYEAFGRAASEAGVMLGGEGLQPTRHGDHRAGPRRRDGHERRPVRGDARAARRLLPARLPRPRRRDQLGGAHPRRAAGLDRGPAGDELRGRRPRPRRPGAARPRDEVHAAAVRRRGPLGGHDAGGGGGGHAALGRLLRGAHGLRRVPGRRGPRRHHLGHHRPDQGRRGRAHRRPVRRDARAARRLLPARVPRPRRRARLGRQGARPGRRRVRRGPRRSWTTRPPATSSPTRSRPRPEPEHSRGTHRPPVPARVRAGGRRPGAGVRRPRPRRGGRPGRLRRRARALAARRRAGQPGGVDHARRRATRRSTGCAASAAGRAPEALARIEAFEPDARRAARADLRLLPPGARAGGARSRSPCARSAGSPRARWRAPSSSPRTRWRSGSSAPSASCATPASASSCRARRTCRPAGRRCWRRST